VPAILRLALALTTLTVFWLALFVSDAANTAPASTPAVAASAPDGDDAAAIDRLLVESREA